MFANRYNANINADNFNIVVGDGNINADILTLSVAGDFDYATEYLGNGNINATTLNFQVGGDFSYSDTNSNFVWDTNNSLVVLGSAFVTANDFSNKGRIDVANSFNVSAGDDFFNKGRIDVADNFNLTAGDDFYNWYGAIINTDSLNVAIADRFYNLHSAEITTNSFNLVAGGLFANRYSANINANSFNVSAGDSFYNTDSATINANDLTISTDSFVNSHPRGDGNIIANTLTLSLIGDFDYASDFGNIDATNFNFQVGGDFSYNDASNDFVWNENDNLVVLGSAFVTANDFSNKGRIDIANDFNVTAGDDFFNKGRIDVADNFDLLAGDNFYNWYGAIINAASLNVAIADRFYNLHSAEITTNNFNLVAGGLFANRYSANINANNFNVSAGNGFYNTDSATISANDLTISTDSFVNSHTRGDGNINADILTLSVAGDFDYATEYLGNGNINATTLNFRIEGDFSYNDASNDFVWNANNSLVVLGSAFVTANDFSNKGRIDVANSFNVSAGDSFYNTDSATINANDLTISTDSFVNSHPRGDGNIIANTLTLSLIGDFDYANDFGNNGNIEANNQYFTISDGDFTNNTSIVLEGNLGITADSYSQSGTIKVANHLNIAVSTEANLNDTASIQSRTLFFSAYNLYNQADLTVTDSATFDIGNDFYNGFYLNGIHYGGDIIANNFNVTAGHYFFNDRSATINANNFNVTAGDYFYNWHGSTINADNFNVTAERFSNEINATISADNFNVETGTSFYNYANATINANTFNVATRYDFYNYANATINANTFNVVTRYDFYNYNNATINADNFNATAGEEFYNYATIEADSLTISADSLVNTHSYWGDGNISVDKLILSLTEGFDYTRDYLNNGNIEATTLTILEDE